MRPTARWAARLLRLLGHLVPGEQRDEWVREWEAELSSDTPRTDGKRRHPHMAAAAEDALRLGLRRLARLRPGAALRDVRFAARALARAPWFTTTVAFTLALGIGANATMFTVAHAVLLEPLPYPEAERLVRVGTTWLPEGDESSTVSTADFDDLVERIDTLEHLSLRAMWSVTYQADEPVRLNIAGVSSGFFRLFGTAPHLGRYFLPEEDEPGHQPAVVLSHGLWQRLFGGDRELVGRTLALDGQPYVVVGIAEPEFRDPAGDADLWASRPAWIDGAQRDQPWLQVFGRLAPDATLATARQEIAAVSRDLADEHPDTNARHAIWVASLKDALTEPIRPALLALAAVVGLVLVVTCANVANLVLARSAGRDHEMAVRMSLGSGRARLAGQLLAEGLLLALLGGAAGLALAVVGTRALVALGAPGLPRLSELRVDAAVLLFTAVVSAATGMLLGLAPVLQISGSNPSRNLRQGGRGGEGRRVRRVRRALVVAEIAASAVLLVGSGLLLRSLLHLTQVETGIRTEGVLVLRVSPPAAAYPTPAHLRGFYEGVRAGIARLPGVEAVGGVSMLPFTDRRMYPFTRDDRPPPRSGEEMLAELRAIEPDYFASVGIPLVTGRLLDERDAGDAPPAILLDEAMAQRFFAGESPIGKRLTVSWGQMAPEGRMSYEVVGIVGNVRHHGPASPHAPTLYVPRGHDATPYWENGSFVSGLAITARTSGDPVALAPAAKEVVWDIDRTVPITQVGTLEDLLSPHSSSTRHLALLIGGFALLAMILASVGLAGVVAYAVAQRRHELGVRQALGADAGNVVRLVVGEGFRLVALGVPAGLALAAAGARLVRSFLYGVEPGDPATYAAVGLLLATVALAAAWIPARQAAGVSPVTALRR